MEPQSAIQPQPQTRRLKDFLHDQTLPFPHSRKGKSTFSIFLNVSSLLRRRFSKIKSSSRSPQSMMARTTSVTVKDILRWKSFRDLADPVVESYVPQLPESPSITTDTTVSDSSTPRSSWSDSDFTVGDSPVWCRGNEKSFRINVAGGGEKLSRKPGDEKDVIIHEEDEQFSPVSVLDFTQEHEQSFSPFHQILANINRRNVTLKQQIQDFENLVKVDDHCFKSDEVETFEIEERAIQLLDCVKTTCSIKEWDTNMDCLLLDFIRDELITTKRVKNNGEFESRILSSAKSWVRGEYDGSMEWEMEKRVNRKDFEDDQENIGIEIEKMVLNHLLDELTIELFNF